MRTSPLPSLAAVVLALWLVPLCATAATYYVDFAAGSDTSAGTSPDAAFKHSPGDPTAADQAKAVALVPGDTVLFKGGVVYRGSVVTAASGAEGKPITFDGNTAGTFGQGRAIIDGSELLTGWQFCASAEECGGNPNFKSIYRVEVNPPTNPLLANLYQGDEMLWPAQDPNIKDPFYQDRYAEYRPFDAAKVSPISIVDETFFTQTASGAWDGAYVAIWAKPNYVYYQKVTGYEPEAHRVSFEKLSAEYYADRPGRYSMLNSLAVLDMPGEYVFRDQGGKTFAYLWPVAMAKGGLANLSVSVSRRSFGFDLNGQSYLTVRGLEIRNFVSRKPHRGAGVTNDQGSVAGLVVRDNIIRHCAKDPLSGWKHGAINLGGANRSRIEKNELSENRGCVGTFAGGEDMVVQGNTVRRCGYVGIWVMGGKRTQVLGNTVLDCLGTHSDGMAVYQNSEDVLVRGNTIINSQMAMSLENGKGHTFCYNVFHSAGGTWTFAYWRNCTDVKIFNNVLFCEGGNVGLMLTSDLPGLVVKNNIIHGAGLPRTADVSHNLYTNVMFVQEKPGWKPTAGESIEKDLSKVFVDAAKRDFRLKPGSPAIDAGTDVGLKEDLSGTKVPQGKAPDIGAYEFVSGQAPAPTKDLPATPASAAPAKDAPSPAPKTDAPAIETPAAAPPTSTKAGPPAPKLEDLSLKAGVSQYGITWTFDQPARVGQFVNGDWYVVGPVRIVDISPKPENGRNGSCLNVTATEKAGFDSRMLFGRYDEKLYLAPPISLKPGDSLLSSVSLEQVSSVKPMLWRINKDQRSPIRTIAALTCLAAPVPPDAFRPAYCGKQPRVYLARDLKRELLPRLPREGLTFTCHQGRRDEPFTIQDAAGWFQRPWIDLVMDEFGAPVQSMPVYGQEYCRAVGLASLLLCLDFKPEEKEKLLVGFVQVGLDLWGLAGQGSQPSPWNALGGHGNGRKWPILFAGRMLGDTDMQQPVKKYPYLRFSEDTQTMFGPCWTGAKVVWAGHVGQDGNPKYPDWGAYEHLPPKEWKGDTGESYRRCCTSKAWVAEALAVQLLGAEKLWDHDAFLVYADRWMHEDDTEFVRILKEVRGTDYNNDWARQGAAWDPFVNTMWAKFRPTIAAPTDRWKK